MAECVPLYVGSLFFQRSQVAFMPYGVVLKDERPTSNIERPTSNNDVTTLFKLF